MSAPRGSPYLLCPEFLGPKELPKPTPMPRVPGLHLRLSYIPSPGPCCPLRSEPSSSLKMDSALATPYAQLSLIILISESLGRVQRRLLLPSWCQQTHCAPSLLLAPSFIQTTYSLLPRRGGATQGQVCSRPVRACLGLQGRRGSSAW